MIADTDAGLRERLYGRLLDIDVFSDCVNNGPDALRKLEESRFGLVIADVGLPDDGIEAIVARIASMQPAERPIVLVLSPRPELTRSLNADIVQIVLRRPVDVPQLIELVRNCFRNSSTARRDRRDEDGDGDGTQATVS